MPEEEPTVGLPWRRPHHELALLALVALVALTPVYLMNAQDVSRLCLSRSLAHGHLSSDRCLEGQIDKSTHGGHLYTDKAPGISVLEVPTAELLHLQPIEKMDHPTRRLWLVRILSSGVAFLVCALLVGRLTEGLAPGAGGAALVTFALGSSISGLAASNFGHITAGALVFAAFLLAWGGRPWWAGLAAGAAPLVEYQTAAVVVILAVYLVARDRRALAPYIAGLAPGLALLLAYNWLAFGAPWHLSYQYLDNGYAVEQASGLFGVGSPSLFATYEVLSGPKGLLVVSPVVIAAAWGLVLLARRYRNEALVCGAVVAVFAFLNCGYFLPYGGVSPGPRFLVPALPFLAAGLGPAFASRPRLTAALATVSIVGATTLMLVWAANEPLRGSIWGELVRVPVDGGSSRFVRSLSQNALEWLGVGRQGAAVLVLLAAGAALVLALRSVARVTPAPGGAGVVLVGLLGLAVVATASAVSRYPYGSRVVVLPSVLSTTIAASTTAARPGDEVDFTATVTNPTRSIVGGVVLKVELPPGLVLLGRPYYERGSGCGGSVRMTCNLDFLLPRMSTQVRFGVRVDPSAAPRSTVTASTDAGGAPGRRTSLTVATSA